MEAIGKDINTRISHHSICSEHFKTEDFEQYGERKKLKPNVIPTLKLPVVEAPSAAAPLQVLVIFKHGNQLHLQAAASEKKT